MKAETVSRFYNRCAGIYDLLFDQVFREGRRLAFEAMNLRPGQRVLEVGVGTGLTLPMYPTGVQLVGIDLSGPMLEEASERRGLLGAGRSIGLVRMDANSIAAADDSFDVVFAPYVISVVPDPRRVVSEMARVCRPGGLVVVLNHFESRHRLHAWFERQLSPLTHRVGFRLDLPVETILDLPSLEVLSERRVNMFRLWSLIIFRRGDVATHRALAPDALHRPQEARFARAEH